MCVCVSGFLLPVSHKRTKEGPLSVPHSDQPNASRKPNKLDRKVVALSLCTTPAFSAVRYIALVYGGSILGYHSE